MREIDREGVANEAMAISTVINWVIDAQTVLEDLRISCQMSPELSALVKEANITINSPEWSGIEMADQLHFLGMRQRDLIRKLANGANHG